MTEPIAPAVPPDDTATLLAAGLASERSSSRWQPPGLGELQDGFPNLEIIALLGSGGMGAVYLARQRHLDRRVALKLLNPARAGDPQFDERFTREARALARLDHANIIRIHDFGRSAGRAFLLMEYIEGSNLRQVMATGALSGTEALRLVGQLCDALAHAHAAGVVHRDLKPENIMIDGRGDAHIADFGLAKIADTAPSLTGTGEVLGTLHYMAPEQLAAAAHTDHRVDLYALGVITYEMLTGSLPLGRFDPPSHRSGIGPALDPVVLRSLEQDPSRRYSSAVDLGAALAQAGSVPATTRTPSPAPAPASRPGPSPAPDATATRGAQAPPPGAGAAEEPTRVPEVEPPPSRTGASKVQLSWDGLHVQDGKDTVHIGPGGIHVEDGEEEVHIGLGGIQVRERKQGGVAQNVQVQFGRHAGVHGLAAGDGSSSCYAAGMMAIFIGSLLAIGFANGRLFDFLADPTAHFAGHRVGDLAMLAVPAYLAGGIALISRCCLPMVIIGGIAELMLVPWLWQEHNLLFWLVIVPLVWRFQTIFRFKRLRAHMASLAWHGRLLRLVWVLPIVLAALAAPFMPWTVSINSALQAPASQRPLPQAGSVPASDLGPSRTAPRSTSSAK